MRTIFHSIMLAGSLLPLVAVAEDLPAKTTQELIQLLDSGQSKTRDDAAQELALRDDNEVVPAIKKRIEVEQDFHVRLALHYALAFHGEKKALDVLVDSMKQMGHFGVVFLCRVTGRDFGWEADLWKKWIEQTSDEEFQRIVERQRLPADVRDGGWAEFLAAVTSLQEVGDRSKAAKMFRKVSEDFLKSDHGVEAKELAELLEKMADEDKHWVEPADIKALGVEERIKYDLYKLRDVNCYQHSQPGMCCVLSDFDQKEGTFNAAIDLCKIGKAVIPTLIDLLDDRRPTRSVGFWRLFAHSRTVLRYQDAASQILNELLPAELYRQSSTGAYLSNERPEVRKETVAASKEWYAAAKDKPVSEQKWLALKNAGIYPTLKLLRSLALEDGQKDKVLVELGRMYKEWHWVYQPHIAELMAELGDKSKVLEVIEFHKEGKYSKYSISRPDDGAASLNAEEAAKRLFKKYNEQP